VADALRWIEPAFILIDSIVLITALWNSNKRFKKEKNLESNEGYMCLHIVLVFLLVGSTFALTFASEVDDKFLLVSATTYLTLNTSSAFLWAYIMGQVSSKHQETILSCSMINQTQVSEGPMMSESKMDVSQRSNLTSDQNSYISESAHQEDDMIMVETASKAEYQRIDYEVLTQESDMGSLLYRVN
jgi:hypothetical protein